MARFGMGLQGITQAFSGFREISQASDALCLAGDAAAVAGSVGHMLNGVSSVLGVFSLMSSLFEEESEESGLGEALSAIYLALQGMWTEMRTSVAETWRMLETMEEHNAKRFCMTKAYLEDILMEVAHSRSYQDAGFTKIQTQLGRMHTELSAGLNDVLDQNCLHAIEEIRQGDEAYLEAHYPSVVSRLVTYLIKDATSGLKTGYMHPLEPLKTLEVLRPSGKAKPLGLLAAIANSVQPDFVREPAGLIGGNSWSRVSRIYGDLVRYRGIREESARRRVMDEVSAVRGKATQVCDFLQSLSAPETGRPLFDGLVAQYVEHLTRMKERVEGVLEETRRKSNRDKLTHEGMSREAVAEIESRVLLRLDETLEETSTRLAETPVERWQKPVDWAGMRFTHASDASEFPESSKRMIAPVQFMGNTYNGIDTPFGDARLGVLQRLLKGEAILPPEKTVLLPQYRDAARVLFSLETNPLLNIALTYNVITDINGRWMFAGVLPAHRIFSSYFLHTIQVNKKNIPITSTQFSVPLGVQPNHLISQKTAFLMHPFAPVTGVVCDPITPLITEANLLDIVIPDLTPLLNADRQTAARVLSADPIFLQERQHLERIRLSIFSLLGVLGVTLTPEQEALLVSEQTIHTLLEKIAIEPSAEVVKSLLGCLDLNTIDRALSTLPASTPLAVLQNRFWDFVPCDVTGLPLYQHMFEADGQLAGLVHDLRGMAVRPMLSETKALVRPDATLEIEGLREDIRRLQIDLVATREESQVQLRAMQETNVQILAMLQQLLMQSASAGVGVASERPIYDPRYFAIGPSHAVLDAHHGVVPSSLK